MSLQQSLQRTFHLLLVLFASTLAALAAIDTGLKVPASPFGIVSFEFCGMTGHCEATLVEWGERGRALAMLSLGVDYLFLLVYPGLVCCALLRLAPRLPAPRAALARRAAVAVWGAGLADALENYALIRLVLDGTTAGYGAGAAAFATLKFALLFLVLGTLFLLWRRAPQPS